MASHSLANQIDVAKMANQIMLLGFGLSFRQSQDVSATPRAK